MPTNPTANSFNLVVVGAHNPSIHHPLWYRQHDLISDEELKQSLDGDGFACMPVMAQFSCSDFMLTCDQSRWLIATKSQDSIERVVELAIGTFDILDDTPVSAFGVNTESNIEVDVASSISEWLRERVDLPSLGLDNDTVCSPRIHVTYPTEHGHRSYRINESNRGKKIIFVGSNHHRDCTPEDGKFKKFDLGELVRDFVPEAIRDIDRIKAGVHEAIK